MSTSVAKIRAPGKVNLFLELHSRRSDGFHEMETVIVSIGLHDELLLRRRSDRKVKLSCSGIPLAKPDQVPLVDNLVVRAIELMQSELALPCGFDVHLFKRIPSQAGLGGGSSDAASALLGVNQLLGLNLSTSELLRIGNQLGSDIAFFLVSTLARCTGRGEQVVTCEGPGVRFWMVIATPPEGLSTPQVFRHSRVPADPMPGHSMLQALRSGCPRRIAAAMFNRLQAAADLISPWISRLKREFSRTPCYGHQMTGSGSSYFGVYHSLATARRACARLRSRLPEVSFFSTQAIGLTTGLSQRVRFM